LPAFVLEATSYLTVWFSTEFAGIGSWADRMCNRRAVQRMRNRGETGGNGEREMLG
jgi:hypothetical protein